MSNHPAIDFYYGNIPNSNGKYYIDIINSDDIELEDDHLYIQWLFPNRQQSFINLNAPLLNDQVIKLFKADESLQEMIRISLDRMIQFYQLDQQTPWWITKNNHNYLRCTRILNTLREFEMKDELFHFYSQLLMIYINNYQIITPMTFLFWKRAYHGAM